MQGDIDPGAPGHQPPQGRVADCPGGKTDHQDRGGNGRDDPDQVAARRERRGLCDDPIGGPGQQHEQDRPQPLQHQKRHPQPPFRPALARAQPVIQPRRQQHLQKLRHHAQANQHPQLQELRRPQQRHPIGLQLGQQVLHAAHQGGELQHPVGSAFPHLGLSAAMLHASPPAPSALHPRAPPILPAPALGRRRGA
jgi:hypothetical protein